jgi:hypothetical protein
VKLRNLLSALDIPALSTSSLTILLELDLSFMQQLFIYAYPNQQEHKVFEENHGET